MQRDEIATGQRPRTIAELQAARVVLEQSILHLLIEFQESFGANVRGVELTAKRDILGQRFPGIGRVRVDIDL